MKYDYTWRCDCDAEATEQYLLNAGRSARFHLANECKLPAATVFIDRYSYEDGELDGWYTTVTSKAIPAKR